MNLYLEIDINFGNGSGDGKAYCDIKDIHDYVLKKLESQPRQLLKEYSDYLHKSGYIDSDYYTEQPDPIEEFLKSKLGGK